MLGVFADNHDVTLALDDLALLAHGLYGRSHFHVASLLISIQRLYRTFARQNPISSLSAT